jgi:hypothetical protein
MLSTRFFPLSVLFCAGVSAISAQVIVTDAFSYADGDLAAVSSWNAITVSGGTPNLSVESGAVSYETGADTTIRTLYQRDLGQTVSSGSLYYTFTFNASVASTTSGGQRIAGFGTGAAASDSMRGQLWLKGGSTADTFLFGVSTAAGSSASTAWWGSDLSINTDYQIVLGYDLDSGNSALWIDPTSEGSVSLASIDASAISGRSTIGLYNRTNVNLGSYTIDDLVVSTAFPISAVPEPETYGLLAGSLMLGMALWHRRRCVAPSGDGTNVS